jgi:uncharacterized protein (DUF4415 family)
MDRAVPAGDLFPAAFNTTPKRRGRPRQATPTKQLISLRLDRQLIADYRATGRGWQARIAEDLAVAAKRRAKRARLAG